MNQTKELFTILGFFHNKDNILTTSLMGFLQGKSTTHDVIWKDVYDYGIKLDIIAQGEGKLKNDTILTEKGLQIVDRLGQNENRENIKEYIFLNCVFDNEKFSYVRELVNKFHSDGKKRVFFIAERKKSDIPGLEILRDELGVISFKTDHWYINSRFKSVVEINQNNKAERRMTKEELDKMLNEQIAVGNCAEELSEKYEKSECQNDGRDENMVERISGSHVNAGYDINSMHDENSKTHDKFIEVKGRKYSTNSFIISYNELETARREKKNYVIYFWNNLGSRIKPKEPTRIIYDPIKKLKIETCPNCLKYLIKLS